MIGKLVAGPVTLIKHVETVCFPPAACYMFFGYTARPANGRSQTERVDERCPAGELRPLWNSLVLKAEWFLKINVHASKICCYGRKVFNI